MATGGPGSDLTHPSGPHTLPGMRGSPRALVAGAVMGAGVGACWHATGCLTAAERQALSVADCVAQMALALPQRDLPQRPGEVTSDDLVLAVQVVDGVRTCRRSAAAAPDGGR